MATGGSSENLKPDDQYLVAFLYFMASLVISCGSWVLFGSLRFNKFYRTNHREALLRVDQKKSIKEEVRKLSVVFKKTWRLQICILYTLTVTITVFPGLQLGIEPQVCYDSGVNISSPPPAPLLSSLETKHLPPHNPALFSFRTIQSPISPFRCTMPTFWFSWCQTRGPCWGILCP